MIITSIGLLVVALVLLVVGIVKSGVSYLVISAIATLVAGGFLYASFIYYRNKAIIEGRIVLDADGAIITPGYPAAYGALGAASNVTAAAASPRPPVASVTDEFEDLTAKQAADLVSTLNLDELHQVRRFEVEHENRRTVLGAIDARVDAIVSLRRSLSDAS